MVIEFGRQVCGSLAESAAREWLVTDGLGGYAMGTVAGLRTRRYHGLLMVAGSAANGNGDAGVSKRMLGLAALDPVLVVGDTRIRLATDEWAGGAVDPAGHRELESFTLDHGIPRWRWVIGDIVFERELAMLHGRPAVAVRHRLVAAGGRVDVELTPLCTWRDGHSDRHAGADPTVEATADGFVFEHAYRVQGPEWAPGGSWYRGVRARAEADRGLADVEDLWAAGRFTITLAPGESADVLAWAGDLADPPPPAAEVLARAKARASRLETTARATDEVDGMLARAADQFVVSTATGPSVVAGYPWFGEWSRDTMTSYEGLFLSTRRFEEGRDLLARSAATLSEGMLANTADAGGLEYNTADGTLWFIHAVGRHVAVTGDVDILTKLNGALDGIIDAHSHGTRFGIKVDPSDGLLQQGAPGWALTWMDARVDGQPITQREREGSRDQRARGSTRSARSPTSTPDSAATPDGGSRSTTSPGNRSSSASRAVTTCSMSSEPPGPMTAPFGRTSCSRCRCPTLPSTGPRSPATAPWPRSPQGSCAAAAPSCSPRSGCARSRRTIPPTSAHITAVPPNGIARTTRERSGHGSSGRSSMLPGDGGVLDGLIAHLGEWGLGSVSETADGDAPHAATGCPFQAWSVAELFRARRAVRG